MLSLKQIIRIPEWWDYIIPRYLGIVYFLIFHFDLTYDKGFTIYILFIAILFFTASFGYLLNEITDLQEDQKAGKKNRTERLTQFTKYSLLFLFLLLSFLPWSLLPVTKLNFGLFCIQFLLFFSYSVPPFRWKRYPVMGAVLDALYNNVVFTFIIITTVAILAEKNSGIQWWMSIVIFVWAFLKGLRGILLHLIMDRKYDKVAGKSTFITEFGPVFTINLINRFILPVELTMFFAIVLALSLTGIPLLWLIFPFFYLYLFLFFRLWERNHPWRKREVKFRYLYILNDLYEEWLPIIGVLILPFFDFRYCLLIPIHLLLFNRTVGKLVRNTRINIKNCSDWIEFLDPKNKFLSFHHLIIIRWNHFILQKTIKKVYWYFHGHFKYYMDTYFKKK